MNTRTRRRKLPESFDDLTIRWDDSWIETCNGIALYDSELLGQCIDKFMEDKPFNWIEGLYNIDARAGHKIIYKYLIKLRILPKNTENPYFVAITVVFDQIEDAVYTIYKKKASIIIDNPSEFMIVNKRVIQKMQEKIEMMWNAPGMPGMMKDYEEIKDLIEQRAETFK